MKPKVLMDASAVGEKVDGLSIYIVNLIRFLPPESFDEFDFYVLVNKGLVRPEFRSILNNGRFTVLEDKIASIGPKRDWNMFWFLKRHKKSFDVIHVLSNWYPLALKGGVGTIHDITFKKYFDNPKFTFNFAQVYLDFVIRQAMKNAKAIIAVSSSTKEDLVTTFKLRPQLAEKIKIIYEGWQHLIHGNTDDHCIDEIIPAGTKYIFYLGSLRKHKNISKLLAAFKFALPELPAEIKLVMSGQMKFNNNIDQQAVNEINKNGERVIITGYLSDSCAEKLFRNCEAFILPSLSEGFGLPLLEAFYFDKPVLCSNLTSLPEVAGNAALYFDPLDQQDIAAAMVKLFQDGSLRKRLIEEGSNRLQYFSWDKAATETLDLYRQIIQKKRNLS